MFLIKYVSNIYNLIHELFSNNKFNIERKKYVLFYSFICMSQSDVFLLRC